MQAVHRSLCSRHVFSGLYVQELDTCAESSPNFVIVSRSSFSCEMARDTATAVQCGEALGQALIKGSDILRLQRGHGLRADLLAWSGQPCVPARSMASQGVELAFMAAAWPRLPAWC
ncbi:MAG: hypothetical protein ACLSAH_20890 [Bilophila wadsworthia]